MTDFSFVYECCAMEVLGLSWEAERVGRLIRETTY